MLFRITSFILGGSITMRSYDYHYKHHNILLRRELVSLVTIEGGAIIESLTSLKKAVCQKLNVWGTRRVYKVCVQVLVKNIKYLCCCIWDFGVRSLTLVTSSSSPSRCTVAFSSHWIARFSILAVTTVRTALSPVTKPTSCCKKEMQNALRKMYCCLAVVGV